MVLATALGGAVLALAGCLAAHPRLTAPDSPEFRPEVFFNGLTRGTGTLRIRGRAAQTVRVESLGTPQPDGSFRLDQTVWIGDAAPRLRSWQMRRAPSGDYTATLTDASGPVRVRVEGATLRLRYRLNAVATMHQRLVLKPDGQSALNQATVRVLGLPWARLAEDIVRAPGVPGQPSQ